MKFLEWVAWDSFEFEKASRIYGYSFHVPCAFYDRSYYAPFWCDLCNSFDHNVSSYPYYACYAHPDSSLPLAQCTWFEGVNLLGMLQGLVGLMHVRSWKLHLMRCIIQWMLLQRSVLICLCTGGGLAQIIVMLSPIPSIIPMFLPFIPNLHCPSSVIVMRPLMILRFVILMLIQAMRITCLMHLVGMLKILGPQVTLVGMMPPLTHIAYTQWTSLEKSYGTLSLLSLLIFLWCLLC